MSLPRLTKHCPRCSCDKPANAAFFNRSAAYGLDYYCKVCRRAAARESLRKLTRERKECAA